MQLAKTIAYWTTTGLLGLAMLASSAGYLTGSMNEAMAALGLPVSFAMLLGAWKGLGAIGLLVPALPRVKEWAYAGLFFTFTGAAVMHLAAGDSLAHAAPPLVMGILLVVSYLLRPAKLWVNAPSFALPQPKHDAVLAK